MWRARRTSLSVGVLPAAAHHVPVGATLLPGNLLGGQRLLHIALAGGEDVVGADTTVHLLLEPLEPGSGVELATRCSEDTLDRNWQRLVLTHLAEKEHLGVLTGAPITDVRITLLSGRAHVKHTEGGDFREATYRAVRMGLMRAESVLLEP